MPRLIPSRSREEIGNDRLFKSDCSQENSLEQIPLYWCKAAVQSKTGTHTPGLQAGAPLQLRFCTKVSLNCIKLVT